MKKIYIIPLIICSIFIIKGGYSLSSKYEGMLVRKIAFDGLININPDEFIDAIITEEGYPLKGSEIQKDIKAVFRMGQLENVKVEVEDYRDGVYVKFVCKERPLITTIKFKGIEELYETDLIEILLIKEGDPLRIDLLDKSIRLLEKKYFDEGLFNVDINYKIKKEKKNMVTVSFIIDEGEEIKVSKISILGAKKIDGDDLIGVMETKEDGWFSDGTFNNDIYEQDKGKILAYYKEKGYLDADIIEDKVEYEWEDPEEKEKRAIFITIKIIEGGKYYFDGYSVSGNKIFKTKFFEYNFEQKKIGSIFNDTLFQKDRHMISFSYASKGYIFARVIPKRTIEEREVPVDGKKETRKFIKTRFDIKEGSQAYIENIIIKGNHKTKDKVIRRELFIKENELFNSQKMQISREKIFNLGFFKEVNLDIRPGSKEGYMNLIIDVEEQPTGTISLGGGYGTSTGFSIFTDIGENNLLGNGQRIGVRFEYGPLRNSVTLSFSEPWLFEKPIGFSSSVFYNLSTIETSSIFSTPNQSSEYQTQSFGYSLGLSYRFWYYYGIGTIWRQSFRSIINPSGNCRDAVFLESSQGVQDNRTITFYTYRDSKDHYMNPTKGWRAELSISFTGGYIIRGDDHFIEYSPELFYYYSPFHIPFLRTHPCVIELRANGTFIKPPFNRRRLNKIQSRDKNLWLETENRLYIGGPETLRGWDRSHEDVSFQRSWREGLFHKILYGIEFRVPLHPQMLWVVLFFDAGSLWTDSFWEKNLDENIREIIDEDKENDLLYDINKFYKADLMSYFKYSWGFGFKIQIPMMPLRFWFGKKMAWVGKNRGYFKEISGFNFQFGIGDMRF